MPATPRIPKLRLDINLVDFKSKNFNLLSFLDKKSFTYRDNNSSGR
jgi:hypothetical protein